MKHKQLLRSRFPISLFFVYLVVLLLMCGVHTGILVLMEQVQASSLIQTLLPILYWSLVAVALTLFTRRKIITCYDRPMQQLAQATRQVAQGDFSVYVPPVHTPDKRDYLDQMLLDFNQMVAELGSIETMKTDFISNVSHEIKSPLAVISNCAQMLKAGTLSAEEQADAYDTILTHTRRLAELVMNILKLNKIENQVIKPVREPYDLCRQLSECALLFEEQWERGGIKFEFETEDRAVICADQEMLAIVWNNLLSNAFKFTPTGGIVRLTQTSDGDCVCVQVSDTGCGMSRETMDRIFEKFYQGDSSHSTAGNGLGLALALRILQISGGTITVDSTLGEGSVFTVRLPIQNEEEL